MFRPDDWKIDLDHNNRALDKIFDHVSRFLPEDHKLKKSKLLLSDAPQMKVTMKLLSFDLFDKRAFSRINATNNNCSLLGKMFEKTCQGLFVKLYRIALLTPLVKDHGLLLRNHLSKFRENLGCNANYLLLDKYLNDVFLESPLDEGSFTVSTHRLKGNINILVCVKLL